MKYLRKFATKADMADLEQPNVVLIGDTSEVLYNAVSDGVYIQHIDGKLYATDVWVAKGFANDEANGVAVVDTTSFVIAKQDAASSIKWGGTNKLITDIVTTTSEGLAIADRDGVNNTQKIISQLSGYRDDYGITGAPAAEACANYIFPNGGNGYLPAFGELCILKRKLSEISDALLIVGESEISQTKEYWSSTQSAQTFVWTLNIDGTNQKRNKSLTYSVRAFAPLNI